MARRIYLAAVSQLYSKAPRVATGGNAPLHRVLTSYLPTFKDSSKLLTALERTCEPVDYCVDSGAHVWLASFFKKGEKHPVSKVESTLENFIASVKRMPRKPTFVVELDLQRIYGMDVITTWRRDLWKPFEKETGIRVCYVWHQVDEVAKWNAMLTDPEMRYLGVGGDRSISVELRRRMMLNAYAAGVPVHGFASVDVKWMRQIPFYSVDSTSWAVGAQVFGLVPRFDSATGKIRQAPVGNRQMKEDPKVAALNLMRAKGFYPSDILEKTNGERSEKNYGRFYVAAGEVFRQLEEWHTAYWRAKGLDWDTQLRKHGNEPPGSGGGHLKASSVR
jgi:hypothetical protein